MELQQSLDRAHAAAVERLLGRIDYERTAAMPSGEAGLKLDRMRALLTQLGDPHAGLPIVHVAGTKGKGSTSAMIAAALSASGYRTGLFTSPHLDRVEQRIAIDGAPCSGEQLVALVDRVWPVVEAMDREGQGPTYFEITTAMALLHFAVRNVAAAVLEVGLGGRLDSTNVCTPRVSVITSISFDHMKQLGNTLALIAAEKAGIIKPGVPVVSGVVPDEPREVIRRIAAERGCRLVELERDFSFQYFPPPQHDAGPPTVDFRYHVPQHEHELKQVGLGLIGRHQGANAAVALATLAELRRAGWALPEPAVRRGLADCRLPARVEIMSRRPTVVVDAAHNVASVEALVATLRESFPAGRRTLIVACTKDKDVPGMLARLVPSFDRILLTRYENNPRAVPVEELQSLAVAAGSTVHQAFATPAEAWEHARQTATADELICVTGSFFIAAEMRRHIAEQRVAGAHRAADAPAEP